MARDHDHIPVPLDVRHQPQGLSDWIAYRMTRLLRLFADVFFRKRYGHRAVVLETVAAVPGMVGGDADPSEKPSSDGG